MRYYYPEFHTPETLEQQIQQIYKTHPKTYLVGSLGRATVFGNLLGNPFYEFDARGQQPLENGVNARDIDVIGVDPEFAAHTLPFWVDATSYSNSDAKLVQEGHDWFLATDSGFYEEVDAAIMEPIFSKTIYDISCITPPAETLLALQKVRGAFRDKDEYVYDLLAGILNHQSHHKKLPSNLFHAFERLHKFNQLASIA